MQPSSRIAVTGLGILSAAGVRPPEFWNGIQGGGAAFGSIRSFPTHGFACTRAAEIPDFQVRQYLDRKGLRTLSRSAQMLCAASALALDDARLTKDHLPSGRVGVVAGTCFGNVKSMIRFSEEVEKEGPRFVEATLFPNTVLNLPAGVVSIFFGLTGPNSTVSSGTASGLEALNQGRHLLLQGEADILLAGGFEEFSRWLHVGFLQRGQLATDGTPRPFDRDRRGFLLGEGSAVLILETEEHAARRGARIRGFLRGYGCAFAPTRAEPDPPAWVTSERDAILRALSAGQVAPGEIAFISASANGSVMGDGCEALAIGEAFGEHAGELPVTAPKSELGESWGAAAGFQVGAALMALEEEWLPPTAGFETAESGCPLRSISSRGRRIEGRYALVNSFNGAGTNASLLVEKAD